MILVTTLMFGLAQVFGRGHRAGQEPQQH
jgi:hypothetical protein